jgi:hypothetical protein
MELDCLQELGQLALELENFGSLDMVKHPGVGKYWPEDWVIVSWVVKSRRNTVVKAAFGSHPLYKIAEGVIEA